MLQALAILSLHLQLPWAIIFYQALLLIENVTVTPIRTNANVTTVHDQRNLDRLSSGEYSFEVALSDGTKTEQKSRSGKNLDPQQFSPDQDSKGSQGFSVIGSYAFTDVASGIRHEVRYIADASGYRPHIITTLDKTKSSVQSKMSLENAENENLTPLPPLETISASIFSSKSNLF